MRILIADDDDVSRLELASLLTRHGHELTAVADGPPAWDILRGDDPPRLAVLDWLMDEMDGVDVCRRVRERPELGGVHLILLTSRGDREHILEGLRAGADDYVTKPFDGDELLNRVRVGAGIVELQSGLAAEFHGPGSAPGRADRRRGLLPTCSYCGSIRDSDNFWHEVGSAVRADSAATFSHSICPGCWEAHVKPQLGGAPVKSDPSPIEN